MNATQETFRRMFVFLFYNDWLDSIADILEVPYVIARTMVNYLTIENRFEISFL